MGTSKGSAEWTGGLKDGKGFMKPDHAEQALFSLGARFEGKQGSNPEELIGAALSGCFSMALSGSLEKAGHKPTQIKTRAEVHLDKDGDGFAIKRIELLTEVSSAGLDAAALTKIAEETKKTCPVGKLLSSAEITLRATLASS